MFFDGNLEECFKITIMIMQNKSKFKNHNIYDSTNGFHFFHYFFW
jgi:hypothetical protein